MKLLNDDRLNELGIDTIEALNHLRLRISSAVLENT